VGDADGVAGLDPSTGEIIIHYRTGSPVVIAPAFLRAFDPQPDPPGRLVVASQDGALSAFSTDDARLLWRVNPGAGPISAIIIHAMIIHDSGETGSAIIVGAGETVLAFDDDGQRLWATRLEGGDVSKGGAVAIDQTNELVAVSTGDVLYGLDPATGVVIWRAD
jgi:outer membrane protein assembly factor BamB